MKNRVYGYLFLVIATALLAISVYNLIDKITNSNIASISENSMLGSGNSITEDELNGIIEKVNQNESILDMMFPKAKESSARGRKTPEPDYKKIAELLGLDPDTHGRLAAGNTYYTGGISIINVPKDARLKYMFTNILEQGDIHLIIKDIHQNIILDDRDANVSKQVKIPLQKGVYFVLIEYQEVKNLEYNFYAEIK